MNELFKNKYRIKSIRLKDWDYSSNGAYYVTICTKNRMRFLGDIVNGKTILSPIGEIVQKYWREIPKYFQNVVLDEFVIMPDHVHGIIIIQNDRDHVNQCRDAINRVSTKMKTNNGKHQSGGITKNHNPMLSISLSTILRWFKGRSTCEIHKMQNQIYFQWQPRFYEHIIRHERELNTKRKYIINNPLKWQCDL